MLNSRSANKRMHISSPTIPQPPTKKFRTYHLFGHPEDQQQFELMYNALHDQLHLFPQGPLQQIAGFAVGTTEKCNNASCEQEMIILYEDKAKYKSATPRHSKATLLG